MTFKLLKKSSNAALKTFHFLDSDGGVCGSANVPNSEADNFAKCWSSAGAGPAGNPLVAAFRARRGAGCRG